MSTASDPEPLSLRWILDFLRHFFLPFLRNQLRRVPDPKYDFTGQTIIVTGSNVGLGLEAARHFVRLNAAKVILACRSSERGEQAKTDIERSTGRAGGVVEVWPLDLASFESVKQFCWRADQLERLDAVVENASVAITTPQGTLAEGYEMSVTVNVISTFLMAVLLLPTLRRTAAKFNTQPRLTIVSSDAHYMSLFRERDAKKIFDAFKSPIVPTDRYGTTKLLQMFFVRQLAQHLPDPAAKGGIILNTLTPGFCRTALFRDNPFPASVIVWFNSWILGRSAATGARTLVHAAAAGPDTHGKWLDTCVVREPSSYVRGEAGVKAQKRVYDELMEILERVQPGISKNI